MKRRLLALFLVLTMALSWVPVQVLADEAAQPQEIVLIETDQETVPTTEETEPTEETEAVEATELTEETEATAATEDILLLTEDTGEEPEAAPASESHVLPMEIPDDFVAPFAGAYDGLTPEGIPSSYDSRDYGYVTEVKNQNPYGFCWSFSAMASAESSLISAGKANISVDLSEWHLAHSFNGNAYDPLGNASGDRTVRNSEGNNNAFTTFAMANWVGAASEADYPYEGVTPKTGTADVMDDAYHLTNAYWINAQDTDTIKTYIMRNGAVGLSYYSDVNNGGFNFNKQTNAYYNSEVTDTNHAVTVVGWDDNFPASNFSTNPGADGAWLVKNSWGKYWGDKGYFWLSYRDASINTSSRKAFVFEMEPADNYDNNYHYDGSFGIGQYYRSVSSGHSIASVFTASGSKSGQTEEIRAVGVGLSSANVNYSVQIYHNPTNASRPDSGTPMLSTPQTGTTHTAGFYTVKLDTPVRVKNGDTFAVVITLSSSDSSYVYFFADETYQNSNWITFTSHTEPNQTFRETYSGWEDLYTVGDGIAARVKAYTKVVEPLTELTFEKKAVGLKYGEVFSQQPVKHPSNAVAGSYTWTSSDPSVATVNSSGQVKAEKAGTATITVSTTSEGSTFSASYQVTVTDIVLSSGSCGDKLTYSLSSNGTLTITGSGAMKEYGYSDIPWNGYRGKITSVSLPDGLTTIAQNAFYNCTNLESVTIPDGVTKIGASAFQACKSLTSVVIPDSVTRIYSGAFAGCSSLTSVTLPKNIDGIATEIFYQCSSLTSVNIPQGVTYIGDKAFQQCVKLTSVTIPSSVSQIGDCAFFYCQSLKEITFEHQPEDPLTIDATAFAYTYNTNNPPAVDTTVNVPDIRNIHSAISGYNWQASLRNVTYASILLPNTITASDITLTTDETQAQTVSLNASALGGAALSYSSDNPSVTVSRLGDITVPKGFIGTANITITAAATAVYQETTKVITVTVRPYRTITYDANGGEGAPEAVTEEKGTVITLSGIVPTRVDYKFLGWSALQSATEATYQPGDPYTLEENVTLYAVWKYNPSGISIKNAPEVLTSGQSVTLKASAYPDEYASAPITFRLKTSSDSDYLSISGKTLTAKTVTKQVDVTVVASAKNDVVPSEEFTVSIVPKATNVDIYQDDSLVTGKTVHVDINSISGLSLRAQATPEIAQQKVSWKSSSTSIAEVDDDGTVTFHKTGKVAITATAADGSKKYAKVTLNIVKAAASLKITNAPETLQGGKGLTLKTDIAKDKTLDQNVTWLIDPDAAAFASIKAGKLTTKAVYEPVLVHVTACATANALAADDVNITLLPTATAASILYQDEITEKTTVLPLKIGQTLTLEGGSYPEDAYGSGAWKSSNTSIAAVENGMVTGIKAGTATITYTFAGKSTSVKVQVGNPVTELAISAPSSALRSGKSMTLTAACNSDASVKKVTWALANPADSAYCSISGSGNLKAKTVYSVHNVALKAVAADGTGVTAEATISILPKKDTVMAIMDAASNDLTGKTILLEPGEELEVDALTVAGPETVTWKSGNLSVAGIDQSGTITAKKAGTAKITATTADRRSASFTVKVGTKVNQITIGVKGNAEPVVASGKTLSLTAATNANASNKKVTWALNDPADGKYASVSSSGVVKAAANLTGCRQIEVIATAADGSGVQSDPFPVDIYPVAAGVHILKAGRVVNGLTVVTPDQDNTLSAEVLPDVARQKVTWKTSSTRIATVDSNGKVTFLKTGTVTITATAADGSKKSASVKLTYKPA